MRQERGLGKHTLFSRPCFWAGLGIFLAAIFGVTMVYSYDFLFVNIVPDCSFHAQTGYYCFGCGGTRSVDELLHGRLFESLRYHVVPMYLAALFMLFLLSHIVTFLTRGKIKALRIRPVWFYILIVSVILQCIIKNYLLVQYGISCLG